MKACLKLQPDVLFQRIPTNFKIKDACHTIKLSESSKPYFSILPYFSSALYVYQKMSMGLDASPATWQSYINAILGTIPNRSKYLAVMDDLLSHSSKHCHLKLP